ncbi:hypothetical protein PILCRDRAFT_8516 [Piloderma croceum F 1598]|uniref:Uncharacterized protein n=1 Tax=Piloderma croceum (strain F 1598) TaxID=765440 RepID=A0A0C3FB22_PILCF|nr:hypothetical protein PILCRDRAFT_8516 [Piloderma croceum F 1598]
MLIVLATGITLGIFVWSYGSGPKKHTLKELEDTIRRNRLCPDDPPKVRLRKGRAKEKAQKEIETGEIDMTQSCCGYTNPPAFIVVIILNELYSQLTRRHMPLASGELWSASTQLPPDIPLTNAIPKVESATTTYPPEAGVPAAVASSGCKMTPEDSQGVHVELRDVDLEAALGKD